MKWRSQKPNKFLKCFIYLRTKYYGNSDATFNYEYLKLCGDICPNPGSSSNARPKQHRPKQRHGNINLAHLNTRSLKNREHYILAKDLADQYKLDIFTISESWLDTSVPNTEIYFPGFSVFRLDRETKRGGEVCVFVNQSLKADRLNDLSFIAESDLHQL